MQLIKMYLMYLLHQMICHPTENIVHVFVADDAFQMKEYMLKPCLRSERDSEKGF